MMKEKARRPSPSADPPKRSESGEQRKKKQADEVQQSSVDSFPASDPPSFTPSRAGNPNRTPPPSDDR